MKKSCCSRIIVVVLCLLLPGCRVLFPDVRIDVINCSEDQVTGFYVKAGVEEWGENLLYFPLETDENVSIYLDRASYDFMATFSESEPLFSYGKDLSDIEIFTIIVTSGGMR